MCAVVLVNRVRARVRARVSRSAPTHIRVDWTQCISELNVICLMLQTRQSVMYTCVHTRNATVFSWDERIFARHPPDMRETNVLQTRNANQCFRGTPASQT